VGLALPYRFGICPPQHLHRIEDAPQIFTVLALTAPELRLHGGLPHAAHEIGGRSETGLG
jgi:hypothetical protein